MKQDTVTYNNNVSQNYMTYFTVTVMSYTMTSEYGSAAIITIQFNTKTDSTASYAEMWITTAGMESLWKV